ncbi:BnaAnng02000D [Brassica napus]|uniref:BnaAnng02000D protein n=1 Tax=Brassica napus TaxID=3708 RepID=A0A078FCD2_BRANA|nr:BnaAnng02000D [Brassica napus]
MGLESCFSGTSARPLRSDRASARARSLRSDRMGRTFGRYVAADIGPDLVATKMSRGISGDARPTIFNRGTICDGRGEVVQEIEFVAHSVDPAEADAYWVAMCNVEGPLPESWVPMRPFSERVVGRPSRCTLPFLGTIRSFCHVPENVDFRLPLEGERADEAPEGFFNLYEEHLMRARQWFPIPSVIVEFLNRLEVLISQISPRGIKHLIGLLVLGYERGMELTADYLEAFLTLSRVGADRLYGFKPRTFMEVLKGFPQGDCGWKTYFFYVRLDQASVAADCLLSFRRLWGVGGNVLNDRSLFSYHPFFFYLISELCLFYSAQPDSSFSGRSMRRSKSSPWWPAVLGLLLPREGSRCSRSSSISFQLVN